VTASAPAFRSNWWSAEPEGSRTSVDRREELYSGPFLAVVAFSIILLLSPQNWFPAIVPLRIAFLSAGLAIALVLWERWRDRLPLLQASGAVVLGLMLLAWAFATSPLSYWPGGSLALLFSTYVKAVMIFWLLANVVTSCRRLRFLMTVLVLCSLPLSVTAVKNYLTGVFFAGRILGYDAALTSNPNDLALMLNLLTPFALALFLSTDKTWFRGVCLVILVMSLVAVILTFSRGGFLGLSTLMIIYFVKLFRRGGADRVWALAIAVSLLMSIPLLPSSYLQRLSTVSSVGADPTGSSQARWRDNVAAARFLADHPIVGAGIGMDVMALNQVRGTYWQMVHNVYLEYAVDLGLPGLALFVSLLIAVYRAARESKQRAADRPELRTLFLLSEGVQVSLIVFAVAGAFHPVAYNFYFYYIAGLALGTRTATREALDEAHLRLSAA
jgi:putative inorganic carbon (HCO3(-)) transporter